MSLRIKNITKAAPIALGIGLAITPVDYSASINETIENAQVSIVTNTAFAGTRGGGTSGQDDTGQQDAETKNGDTGTTTPCSDCSTTSPTTPTEPKSEKEESETRKCNYKIDFVKNGMVAVGKGAGLNGSDRIVTPRNAKWLRVGKRITFEIPGTVQNEHNWCAAKIGTLHGYYSQVGWNGKIVQKVKKQINTSNSKKVKRGSVYVAPKAPVYSRMVGGLKSCYQAGQNIVNGLQSQGVVKLNPTFLDHKGMPAMKNFSLEGCFNVVAQKGKAVCEIAASSVKDAISKGKNFFVNNTCEAVTKENPAVVPATPAQQTGQACDAKVITASMYFNQAPVNNVVTATVNGVMVNGEMVDQKIVDFKGNQIIGIDCNNNIKDGLDAYANIVATTQTSTFLEKGADGNHKNLSLNKQFHGVVNEPACMSVEKICKAAQSTNSVLGLPEVKRQTMARKNG